MPALTASLQLASLVEAWGIPYVEKRFKVIVAVTKFEKKGKHKADVKALCKGVYRTPVDIGTMRREE
ncbi:hypothetical protein EDD85DRAFT_961500 [Armillaria nabsnona]|nr:hypothetical protein EDD85DRAFT_961500 [Armillaria nabsnona]